MTADNTYIVHADGGSRGNPGPAAAGYTIEGPGIGLVQQGDYLGETTNNVAEYSAAIHALLKLKALLGADKAKAAHVKVHADSELMVKQMNRQYKVKNADLMQLFVQLHNAVMDFGSVSFTHVPRERNQAADRMVNEALDRQDAPNLGI